MADVQPVLQYSNSSVNAVDGIYWRFKWLFSVRVIFSHDKAVVKMTTAVVHNEQLIIIIIIIIMG